MSTTKELLQTLNVLRARAGKAELSAWKSSREKLEAAIAELQPSDGTTLPGWEAKDNAQVPSAVHPTGGASDVSDVGQTEEANKLTPIPRGAINVMCIELLQTDMPYEDIVAAIKERYPTAKTTARSLASVAMDLRADGLTVPSRRKPAKAQEAAGE